MNLNESELKALLEIAYKTAKLAIRRCDDELLSEAHTALWHAIQCYDLSREVPIDKWVALCVRRAVKKYYFRRLKERVEFNSDLVHSTRPAWISIHYDTTVIDYINSLPSNDSRIAKEYWYHGYTLVGTAAKVGLSLAATKRRLAFMRGQIRELIYGG